MPSRVVSGSQRVASFRPSRFTGSEFIWRSYCSNTIKHCSQNSFTSLLPSQLSSSSPSYSDQRIAVQCSLSLSSIGALKVSSFPFYFPINPWEKKVPNSIREQIHCFPISKEHLVHVLAGGCVGYSWSLAPSRLERRPWTLPTCVAAPGGL